VSPAAPALPPEEPEIRREGIKGWPGYYAGNDGRIYSLHSGDFEPVAEWEAGRPRCRYRKVTLYRTRVRRIRGMGRVRDRFKRNFSVHMLIALAFIGRRPRRTSQVRHRDGDRLNNGPGNLMWGTKRQNERDKVEHGTAPRGERNGRAKVSAEQAETIRTSLLPDVSLASIFHLSRSQVRRIRGKSHAQSKIDRLISHPKR
jgi:hypothetical protein